MPDVIANTTPIQYLHQLGLLDLLPAFYGKVIVPRAVAEELAVGRRQGINLPDLTNLPWLDVRDAAALRLPRNRRIHRGEAEVVALAQASSDALLILDDNMARRYAMEMGLRITGTAGVLLRALKEKRIAAVAPLLARLEALGFHLDGATQENILRVAGER